MNGHGKKSVRTPAKKSPPVWPIPKISRHFSGQRFNLLIYSFKRGWSSVKLVFSKNRNENFFWCRGSSYLRTAFVLVWIFRPRCLFTCYAVVRSGPPTYKSSCVCEFHKMSASSGWKFTKSFLFYLMTYPEIYKNKTKHYIIGIRRALWRAGKRRNECQSSRRTPRRRTTTI